MPTYHEANAVAVLSARPVFDIATPLDTALKLKRLIQHAGSNSSPCLEAFGIVLAHEFVRPNAEALRIEGLMRGYPRRFAR